MSKKKPVAPLLVSMSEGALILGVSRARLYQLTLSGAVPTLYVGRRRLIAYADLVEFIDKIKSGEVDGRALAEPSPAEKAAAKKVER